MAAEGHNGGSSPSENPTRVEHSLDELAIGLANGTISRGKAIRWMGSALVGAALASVPGVAWANDRCSEGQSRCNDRCVNLKTNERHCGSCRNRCGSKQTCCNGRCVNLQQNEHHCGSCSNRCAEGEECVDGVCGGGEPICNPPCPEGQECMEIVVGEPPACQPICTPSCPEGTCGCAPSGDGRGNVCFPFGSGNSRLVDSCAECPPADLLEATSCIDLATSPDSVVLACAPPCPQPT
jgi:hypothetical protein